ncbi:probable tubulin polyglutamylase ttll6 [Coccomyxa sp. Obi]|nr:probable tubulin polyglutamylase ttll6 [Coccomyxa sp. Obi]
MHCNLESKYHFICVTVFTSLLLDLFAVTIESEPIRFWIEEYAFSEGETTLLREQIEASHGAAVISGESWTEFLSTKGFYVPDQWDVYWANRRACLKALPHTRPGQKVSCMPGITALSDKRRLIETLTSAYGDGAFTILPRTFLLPELYWDWRLWIQGHMEGDGEKLWVLKENAHRGQGVIVLPEKEAMARAISVRGRDGTLLYEMAQAYISKQLTVAGRKFYLRVWVVVSKAEPVRVYLFNGGVLPFGSLKDEGAAAGKDDGTCSADAHRHGNQQHDAGDDLIVNLWRNRGEAVIWSVDDFRQHLGEVSGSSAAFDRLWAAIQHKIGLTFAAAQPELSEAARQHPSPQGVAFEVLGVDFLVDSDLRPWLLEVNAVPSMARQVLNCTGTEEDCQNTTPNAFDQQKSAVVGGLFQLLVASAGDAAHSVQGTDEEGDAAVRGTSQEQRVLDQSAAELEAARRAGFIPICATAEAAALSNQHQPPLAADDSLGHGAVAHKSWLAAGMDAVKGLVGAFRGWWSEIRSGKGVRVVWVALEWAPRMAARFLIRNVPEEVFLAMAEGIPGADAVIMSVKRLSEDQGWIPGQMYARWQLSESMPDVLGC